MNHYPHTIVSLLSIYFAYKVERSMQKKSLVEEIVFETLTYLETAGLIKSLKEDK